MIFFKQASDSLALCGNRRSKGCRAPRPTSRSASAPVVNHVFLVLGIIVRCCSLRGEELEAIVDALRAHLRGAVR